MRTLASLLLFLLSGQPALAGGWVPGTRWALHDDGWTGAEVQALARLASTLPESWARPDRPVHLRRAEASETRRRSIVLPAAGEDPSRLRALKRAQVQGLVTVLDAGERWSAHPDWRGLSGWSRHGRGGRAPDQDARAYATPEGRHSPRADLATVAAAAWVPEPSSADAHVACRLPSKWRFLAEHVADPPPPPPCAPLAGRGLDPAAVEDIEFVFVHATATSAATIGGHVLVALRFHPDEQGNRRHEAFGMVADTAGTPDGSLRYAWRGLTGGFTSRILWEPFEATLLRYTELEDRTVRRYRLRLDEGEKRAVLERLDELRLNLRRPYFFVHRNCTRLPVELLGPLLGPALPDPDLLSPDMLLAALARMDRVEPLPMSRPQEAGITARARAASRLRREALREVAAEEGPEIGRLLRDLERGDPVTRQAAYRALGARAPQAEASRLPHYHRALLWSDTIEQARRLREGRRHEPEEVLEALRGALVDVRRAAAAHELGPAALGSGQDELLGALRAGERPEGSLHTPYRQLALGTALRLRDGEASTWLQATGALYSSRHGEARRFVLSEEMAVDLLWVRLLLDPARPDAPRGHLRGLAVSWLPLAEGVPRGVRGTLLELRGAAGPDPELRARWVQGGLVAALWQADRHRHHLLLHGGPALETHLGTPTPTPLALSTPLGLELQLASARSPLTALRLRAETAPRVGPGGTAREDLGEAQLLLRLGALRGTDLGLVAEHQVQHEAGAWAHEARLGLRLEGF